MTCGDGMPILFAQTPQEKAEVADWIAGDGPQTPAVLKTIERTGLTFGIALVTRSRLGTTEAVVRN